MGKTAAKWALAYGISTSIAAGYGIRETLTSDHLEIGPIETNILSAGDKAGIVTMLGGLLLMNGCLISAAYMNLTERPEDEDNPNSL